MRYAVVVALLQIISSVSVTFGNDGRTVAVRGHGEIEVEPDVATVEMGIYVFDRDLLKAKKEVDSKMASILSVCKKLDIKIEDVQTTELNVKPKYNQRDDNWEFAGYEITRSVTITLRKMFQLNDVIDKSIEIGANRLEGITLSSSKEQELKDRALALAIENAKRQAERLAQGFGAKVGKVQNIDADRGGDSVMYNLMFAPAFGDAVFHPGRIKIKAEVNVVLGLTD